MLGAAFGGEAEKSDPGLRLEKLATAFGGGHGDLHQLLAGGVHHHAAVGEQESTFLAEGRVGLLHQEEAGDRAETAFETEAVKSRADGVGRCVGGSRHGPVGLAQAYHHIGVV